MKDPQLLLGIISVIWFITLGLFGYIIKIKDRTETSTAVSINEIKVLVNNINLNVTTMKVDLENNIRFTSVLSDKVDNHTTSIHNLQLDLVQIVADNKTINRQLDAILVTINKTEHN